MYSNDDLASVYNNGMTDFIKQILKLISDETLLAEIYQRKIIEKPITENKKEEELPEIDVGDINFF